MTRTAAFRYALEPILLTRQWDVEALLLELSGRNAAIDAARGELTMLQSRSTAGAAEWAATVATAPALPVQRFALHARYMGDLAAQCDRRQTGLNLLEAERDELVARIVLAQRALEAVERHRDDMKARFAQARASGEFKTADDQWNTLHSRELGHDCAS